MHRFWSYVREINFASSFLNLTFFFFAKIALENLKVDKKNQKKLCKSTFGFSSL